MKPPAVLTTLLVITGCALWILVRHPNAPSKGAALDVPPFAPSLSSVTNVFSPARQRTHAADAVNPEVERTQQAYKEHLRLLEKLGHVPEDADAADWYLAQKTTWWGRPLDPQVFWKGRTIWLDKSSNAAARSHGRMFPPMPYKDPQLPDYPPGDVDNSSSWSVEGPNIRFRWSSTEAAFWDRFVKSHPHPPEDVERQQSETANDIFTGRFYFERGGNPARITRSELARGEETRKNDALSMGYPTEAFTEEALFWCYVQKSNTQYQMDRSAGLVPGASAVTNIFAFLAVDPKYVTEPLTEEQMRAANSWKLAYLRRLRSENADGSYINAYLSAWHLSPTEVFGGTTVR